MKIVRDDAALLVVRTSTWGWAALCSLFFITTAAETYRLGSLAEPEWFKFGLLCLTLVGLAFGGLALARKTVVTLDQQSRQMTIETNAWREKQTQQLSFDAIKSVTVELNNAKTVSVGRCVVHTADRAYPLSRSFSGNVEKIMSIVRKIRERVGLIDVAVTPGQAKEDDSLLVDESVLELVKSDQIIQATRVLVELKGLSTTAARDQVGKIQRSITAEAPSAEGSD